MNHLAQSSGINWDSIINVTAPNIGSNATIGQIIGGKGGYPGIAFFLTAISGLAFTVYLIYGGIMLMTSGGDPKKVENGKKTLTNGIIGLLIVIFAYWIVQAVGLVLGLPGITNTF